MGYTELLENSDKFHDTEGWKVIENGGSGWIVDGDGYNGKCAFVTSFELCKKTKLVDLYKAGLTQEYISKNKPEIIASVWVRGTGPNFSDMCYITVQLADAEMQVVEEWNTGIQTSEQWTELKHTFSNYDDKARFVYWEDGGHDREVWKGSYGARFSCASLLINFEKSVDTTPASTTNPLVKQKEQVSEKVKAIINTGQEFIDPEFTSTLSAIELDNEFEWKRARDIFDKKPQLYNEVTDANSIKQGELGDSWFLSALSALAENSHYVKNMFLTDTFNEAGIYELLLYKCGMPHRVVVDEYIPCLANTSIPCFSRSKGSELWALLVEKAYAKMCGSYKRLATGIPSFVLQDLTGCPTITFRLASFNVKQIIKSGTFFKELQKYCDLKYTVTASSLLSYSAQQVDQGIILCHGYSLLAAKQVGTLQLVKLRDPSSEDTWTGAYNDDDEENWTDELKEAVGYVDADDGCFWMSFDDFCKHFIRVTVAVTDKSLQSFRVPVEFNNQFEAVSYNVTITEPDTTIYICSHQEDHRMLGSKPYVNAGALLVCADDKKGLVDASCVEDRYCLTFTTVQPGTYVVVPYARSNDGKDIFDYKGNVCLSIHSNKSISVEKEKMPYAFTKSISVQSLTQECLFNGLRVEYD